MPDKPKLEAGNFSEWLELTHNARRNDTGMDVDCRECIACCTSHLFIHIRPDETQTLKRIPKALLFPAPGLPKGHVLMGYDEFGKCPMLRAQKCTIYEDRPLTCRAFDCRVFPAAGMDAGDEKPLINQQIVRWQFSYAGETDRHAHKAVQSAARFLMEYEALFPQDLLPKNKTQLAVLAVRLYKLFLGIDDIGKDDAAGFVEKVVGETSP